MIDCLLVFCKAMLLYGKFVENLLLAVVSGSLLRAFVIVLEM
ncbi:hypothetical protein EDE11_103259 [Methylomonas methanica]|uniref:Uncharacterized protein n=1 Tax=Methylomonas methanica TaxID=421 RepID=A0ABY2CRM1_METMH|nr:hypothetical protein EDE11_103259 [Methylomonas methanica]